MMGSITLSGNPFAVLIRIHVPTRSVYQKSNGNSKEELFGTKVVLGQTHCGNESNPDGLKVRILNLMCRFFSKF